MARLMESGLFHPMLFVSSWLVSLVAYQLVNSIMCLVKDTLNMLPQGTKSWPYKAKKVAKVCLQFNGLNGPGGSLVTTLSSHFAALSE